METLKLDQDQIDYITRQLSIPSTFDTIQLIISVLTVLALIVTLMLQSQTAKDQLAVALLERKAKKAEYMPFVKVEFKMRGEFNSDGFGGTGFDLIGTTDFYLSIKIENKTITQPRFELESDIPGLMKEKLSLDPDAYWREGETIDFAKVAHVSEEYKGWYKSKDPYFVRCIFIYEDMLGNAYSNTAVFRFPGGFVAVIEPTVSRG